MRRNYLNINCQKKLSRPRIFSIEMDNDSEKTLSDEEFDPNQFDDDNNDDDDDGWEINLEEEINLINLNEEISPSESASQVSGASSTTSTAPSNNTSSTVWLYFDKNPAYTSGYNVCKSCSKKYQLSSSVSTLQKHLKIHQLKAPTKTQNVEEKKECAFDKDEQEEHDKYLVQWLIQGLQPFTVVENSFFRAFVNFLCSRYNIPNRHKAKGKFYH